MTHARGFPGAAPRLPGFCRNGRFNYFLRGMALSPSGYKLPWSERAASGLVVFQRLLDEGRNAGWPDSGVDECLHRSRGR